MVSAFNPAAFWYRIEYDGSDPTIFRPSCRSAEHADVEDLARTGGDHDVLRRDVVMLRDGVDDVAVRVAVPVGILERLGHRLDDGVRRAVRVLVVRELGQRVVFIGRALVPRPHRRRPLRQQVQRGTDANGA